MAYVYSKEDSAAGTGTGFTRELLESGVYDMKLVRITAYLKDPTPQYPEPAPKLRFVWAWVDENGSEYENDEGRQYTVNDDVNMPKNFPDGMKYHEKTTFYKRLSEICGQPILDQIAVKKIGVDLGDFLQSHAEIMEVISNPMEGKPDRKGFVAIQGVAFDGVEQIGRICKIVVKKDPNKNDPTKFYNNVASIMQAQAAQPKRPPTKAAAPAPAAAQAPQAASKPPARPAVPTPAPDPAAGDMPF